MPHIPRSMSSSMSGVRRELLATVRADRPAMPVTPQTKPVQPEDKKPSGRRLGLDRISPHTYSPNMDEICSFLLGTEAKSDEHTGELVFRKPPTFPAAPNGT